MTISQFRQLAAYNRWANARLYAAALDLSDQAYRLHIGVVFGSLHGTLNYLLLTDRLGLLRWVVWAWVIGGVVFLLFGAMNFYTHIGMYYNIAHGTSYKW